MRGPVFHSGQIPKSTILSILWPLIGLAFIAVVIWFFHSIDHYYKEIEEESWEQCPERLSYYQLVRAHDISGVVIGLDYEGPGGVVVRIRPFTQEHSPPVSFATHCKGVTAL